jgi:hypothetical protein
MLPSMSSLSKSPGDSASLSWWCVFLEHSVQISIGWWRGRVSHTAREAVIDRMLARAMASFGRFKPTKAKAAKGITAAAAVKKAYPLYEWQGRVGGAV